MAFDILVVTLRVPPRPVARWSPWQARAPAIVLACGVMACVVMAYILTACAVMAYVLRAYAAMAYAVISYIVMASIATASTVASL